MGINAGQGVASVLALQGFPAAAQPINGHAEAVCIPAAPQGLL